MFKIAIEEVICWPAEQSQLFCMDFAPCSPIYRWLFAYLFNQLASETV